MPGCSTRCASGACERPTESLPTRSRTTARWSSSPRCGRRRWTSSRKSRASGRRSSSATGNRCSRWSVTPGPPRSGGKPDQTPYQAAASPSEYELRPPRFGPLMPVRVVRAGASSSLVSNSYKQSNRASLRDDTEKPDQRKHGGENDRPARENSGAAVRPPKQRRAPGCPRGRSRADHEPFCGGRRAAIPSEAGLERGDRS